MLYELKRDWRVFLRIEDDWRILYKWNVVGDIYEEITTMIARKYNKDLDWKEEPVVQQQPQVTPQVSDNQNVWY